MYYYIYLYILIYTYYFFNVKIENIINIIWYIQTEQPSRLTSISVTVTKTPRQTPRHTQNK
jgi:hypothetical protein